MLEAMVRNLYEEFGQQKLMERSVSDSEVPNYFLLRTFMGENDLLILFRTQRCRYQCHFCQLSVRSPRTWISGDDILAQLVHVVYEMKHSLSILDRITLSNEGSILDDETFSRQALLTIARCIQELRRVRTIVLETRLEFVDPVFIHQLQELSSRSTINILTGFETVNRHLRDNVLVKREPLELFLDGLDKVADSGAELTSYVLYKPSPDMTDAEAWIEAEQTIDYLVEQCQRRAIPLSVRLNPMYRAEGSRWAKLALSTPEYRPPRLTDVMRLAEKKAQEGVQVYIGLSNEGLSDARGDFTAREDWSPNLVKPIILFNNGRIRCFDWDSLSNQW